MAKIRTHYDNLRVARNAPDSVIKAAYKALCQTYHPDKFQGGNAEAERIMKLINTSYVVLIDPVKRAEHDAWIQEKEAYANQQHEKATFGETGEATEQTYQKQETKWKYTPPPTEPDLPEADISPHKWRRYFARQLDSFIFNLLLLIVIFVWLATNQSLPSVITNSNLSNEQIGLWIIIGSSFFAVILEFICLSIFDTTIGKALFRLRLVSDNSEPKYWRRSVAVCLQGMGAGIPFLSMIFMLKAAENLKKNGQTTWDRDTGFSVEAKPLGILRGVLLTVLMLFVFVAYSIIGEAGKNIASNQQSKQQVQVVQNTTPSTAEINCIGDCTNGQGKYTYADGETYSGDFKNGIREGYGTITLINGDKYSGEFKDGMPNGQVTFTSTNGDKYVGEYKDGVRNGQGTYISANGDKYVSDFKDGKANGQGTETLANGDKYVGEYKDSVKNGQGTYIYANGDKYVGEYKDDNMSGQGTFTKANGTIQSGLWENDKFVK